MVKAIRGALSVMLTGGAMVLAAASAAEAKLPEAKAGAASTGDVKAGVDAWGNGDFAGAVREWTGPAAIGDPDAQFNLAQAYKQGRGVPQDMNRAEALYAAAAAQGHLQASDNYGLLLFQRGERAKAMPHIRGAASRGDPRAQYILGLALFNGDTMPKDWVRAYAYVTLAQQAGLPQATNALAQLDQHVPMADRQKSVALAAQIAADAEATRERELAAFDLAGIRGAQAPGTRIAQVSTATSSPSVQTIERAAQSAESATAGPVHTMIAPPAPTRAAVAPPAASKAPAPGTPPKASPQPAAATARPASGPWRLQLGAFGVAGNAEALWARVKGRPELAGHDKRLMPSGKLTRLQATGFASQADANAACARLKSAGFACLPTQD